MQAPQLLLTSATRQAIAAMVSRGHGYRLSFDTIRLRKIPRDHYRLVVPHGFVVHFDTGYYKPQWLCRHLSVQGPGKWPGKPEVRKLMHLAGFNETLEGVVSWADRTSDRHAVHVLEPISGDWSPMRND